MNNFYYEKILQEEKEQIEELKKLNAQDEKELNLNWAELILLPIEEQKKFLEKLTHSKQKAFSFCSAIVSQ